VTYYFQEMNLEMQQTNEISENGIRDVKLVSAIKETIVSLGVIPFLRGFEYIVEAELMILGNGDCINRLRGEVFPQIADKCYSSSTRVERAIRHALEVCWEREGEGKLKSCCSNNVIQPTIGEFLEIIRGKVNSLFGDT